MLRVAIGGIVAVIFCGTTWAASQYWDTSPGTGDGLQGGNGLWSTEDAYWSDSPAGTALSLWTNGNDAFFASNNGVASIVGINGSIDAGTVIVSGRRYTLSVGSGASFSSTGAVTVGNTVGANSNSCNIGGDGAAATVSNGAINIGCWGGSYNSMTVTNANLWSSGLNIGQSANGPFGTTNNSVTVLANTVWNLKSNDLVVGSAGVGYTFGNSLTVNGGILTNVGGTLYVGGSAGGGSAGSYSSLLITNGGAVLLNKGPVYVGLQGGSNNLLTVTGTGSVLKTTSASYAGFMTDFGGGISNNVVVGNGGKVQYNLTTMYVGAFGGGNTIIVTGPGSVWSNRFGNGGSGAGLGMGVGVGYSFNSIIVSNGGTFYAVDCVGPNDGHQVIGSGAAAASNSIVVTGSGSLWTNDSGWGNSRYIGNWSSCFNSMTIADGGRVADVQYNGSVTCIGGYYGAGSNNALVVTDTGSVWQVVNGYGIYVGMAGAGNRFVVSNGASAVIGAPLTVGAAAGGCSNSVLVADPGSIWSNSGNIAVGSATSSFNCVTVTNGGAVSWPSLSIGAAAGAFSNAVIVGDGGAVYCRTITVGGAGATGNTLSVSRNGLATNINTLTIASNNSVNLYGGSIAVTSLVMQAGALMGVDVITPGIMTVMGNATLDGYVMAANLPKKGQADCTFLTCTGSLIGGLNLGPLPYGYTGFVTNNIFGITNRLQLHIKGPSGAISVILSIR